MQPSNAIDKRLRWPDGRLSFIVLDNHVPPGQVDQAVQEQLNRGEQFQSRQQGCKTRMLVIEQQMVKQWQAPDRIIPYRSCRAKDWLKVGWKSLLPVAPKDRQPLEDAFVE